MTTAASVLLPSGEVGAPDQAEPEAEAAAGSLRAFVSYHRLYELWWRSSDASGEERPVNGTRTDAPDFEALLSERHAAHQAAQRSVREVQEKLSAMVLRHSRAQGDEGESDGQRPADAEG